MKHAFDGLGSAQWFLGQIDTLADFKWVSLTGKTLHLCVARKFKCYVELNVMSVT